MLDVIFDARKYFNNRSAIAIERFSDLIKGFILFVKNNDAYTSASHIATTSGLLKELYDDKTVEVLNKYENVQELLNSIKEFIDNDENFANDGSTYYRSSFVRIENFSDSSIDMLVECFAKNPDWKNFIAQGKNVIAYPVRNATGPSGSSNQPGILFQSPGIDCGTQDQGDREPAFP